MSESVDASSSQPQNHEATGRDGQSSTAASSELPPESFGIYLAKRLIGEKQFVAGAPDEASELAGCSHIVLSHADFGLSLTFIIDRQSEPDKRFVLSRTELIDIGRACLKYTGTINGTKMPVGIRLYEIGDGPLTNEDRLRLTALRKTMPGLAKVAVHCCYLDIQNQTAWTSAPLGQLLRRLGYRSFIDRVVSEPRKADAEIFIPEAALPQNERRPLATAVLLAFLLAMFVVEQLAKLGDKGPGLLGVDVGTLFALGGMNADAVLKHGEWYRLLSAALLHGDAFHLLLNGLALGLSGYFLESMLGRAWFISLFFVGALGGSLMGLVVNSASLVSVGASGAVMGLLAAAVVAAMRLPPGATRTQLQMQMFQFLIPSLIPLATHRQAGQIDYAAHFGGALVGGVVGLLLLKTWRRHEEHPRFRGATQGFALASVAACALSLFLVKQHYPAYRAEAAFAAADLLVDDAQIPKEIELATQEVERWGRDRPRDPRVHFFRALRLLDEKSEALAETELRAALAEREILDRAFANHKLEASIRSVLCELLLQQGREDEAKREARPVCAANDGSAAQRLHELHLCD